MTRIHITGASGSGTTTLGRELVRRLTSDAAPWVQIDADDLFWMPTDPPYRERRDGAERLAMALDALGAAPNAVFSGSIVGWGQEVEDAFDLVVFLWLPPAVRLARLEARELEDLGHVDAEFIAWAAAYDEADETMRSRRLHERWLAARRAPVLRLEGDLTVAERVDRTLAALREPTT